MTEESMALVELLEKADDGDFLRAVAEEPVAQFPAQVALTAR